MYDDSTDPSAGGGDPSGATSPSGAPTFDQVNADYLKWLKRPLSQAEYDATYAHAPHYDPGMVANSPEAIALSNQNIPGTGSYDPAVPIAPGNETGQGGAAGGGTGGTGGSGGAGGPGAPTRSIFDGPLTKPFDGHFTRPGVTPLPGVPGYSGPAFPTIPKFTAPSAADALNDPGYAFRVSEGAKQLQNWAAAKGTLNDSGTAHALEDYGQNSATQEYQNVWNRDFSAYNTNVQNQYLAPWQAAFQNATVGNTNALTGYQTNAAGIQHANDTNYLNSWNEFLNSQNQYNNWQDRTFDKHFRTATA